MNERFIQEVLSYLPKKIPQTMRDFFYMALSKGLVGKKVYFDAEAKKDDEILQSHHPGGSQNDSKELSFHFLLRY